MIGLIYNQSGVIIKSVQADEENFLLNIGASEAGITIESNNGAFINSSHYRIENEQIIAKAEVTITADKTTITANGADAATLTFTGLTATVAIQLAGVDLAVTQADPELIITSDIPYDFVVKVFDDLHYSNTITVRAE